MPDAYSPGLQPRQYQAPLAAGCPVTCACCCPRRLPMATYSLVTPFLTDDPMFAFGVEFGILFGRMRASDVDEIEDYFCRVNQDRILLLASRLRWRVALMEPVGKDWFWCRLEREGHPGDDG